MSLLLYVNECIFELAVVQREKNYRFVDAWVVFLETTRIKEGLADLNQLEGFHPLSLSIGPSLIQMVKFAKLASMGFSYFRGLHF